MPWLVKFSLPKRRSLSPFLQSTKNVRYEILEKLVAGITILGLMNENTKKVIEVESNNVKSISDSLITFWKQYEDVIISLCVCVCV